ncbi:MAG: hypothetical protein HUU55_13835 [Myxococcales bacterium]|nr:hypothetical protein [Myxococcales bacterium]
MRRVHVAVLFAGICVAVGSCGVGDSADSQTQDGDVAADFSDSKAGGGGNGATDVSSEVSETNGGAPLQCQPTTDTPVFQQHIAPILAEKCAVCHAATPVGGAPMPLLTYGDTQQTLPGTSDVPVYWAIADAVANKTMPPPGKPELTDDERDLVIRWAEGCAPEGAGEPVVNPENPSKVEVPPPPADATVTEVRAGGYAVPLAEDTYQCFAKKLSFSGEKHIVRFEVDVENPEVVHHIVLLADVDNNSPAEQFDCKAMPAGSTFMYAWAPGGQPLQFPPDMGHPLRDGDTLVLQVHYNNGKKKPGIVDHSGVRLFLTEPRPKEVGMVATGPLQFTIPKLSETKVSSRCTMPQDTLFIAGMPHMHQTGSAFLQVAERLDSSVEVVVSLDKWSFDNQPFYHTPLLLKKGESLVTSCTFLNPSSQPVVSGEGTKDEMCFHFMYHTPPLDTRFCDENMDGGPSVDYEVGSCSSGIPMTDPPTVGGGIRLLSETQWTDMDTPLPNGVYVLDGWDMMLNQVSTVAGTVDLEKSEFVAAGYLIRDTHSTTVDILFNGFLYTKEGASIEFGGRVNESGEFTANEKNQLVPISPCADASLPLIWMTYGTTDTQAATSFFVDVPGQPFDLLFRGRWVVLGPR